ncbi:MAG: hypothetical protein R2775_06390 [Flavobacteriaceae bacterium]
MKATITFLLFLFTSIATFGQTTETRYYNGQYDFSVAYEQKSVQEIIKEEINSYIANKCKAKGLIFMKLEEKPDFLSGTWTLKTEKGGEIFLDMDYFIGDKSLTVKLKYLLVNSQVIPKNHSDEKIKKMYNTAVEMWILDLFDFLDINEFTTPKQANTTTGANTAGQTTETRYYNGKYTKETAFKQFAGYVAKLTKSEDFKFTVERTSPNQIDGTWEQQLSQEIKLVIDISYLLGDDRLTVKIINGVYQKNGQTLTPSPEDEEAAGKLVGRYATDPFEYMEISNNTTQTNTTTTSTSANNTKSSADYPIDNITATYNSSLPLYVRKLNDTTFHYYQNDERITPPIIQEVVKQEPYGLVTKVVSAFYCSYATDKNYYSSFPVEDTKKNVLNLVSLNEGYNYLYIYQKNGTITLNYHGKPIGEDGYELYKTKEYYVIKVKKDNSFFTVRKPQLDIYKKAVCKAWADHSNSNLKALLVHQDNNQFILLELGKPTQLGQWRIEQISNGEWFDVINDRDKIRYYASDYKESLKSGIKYLYKAKLFNRLK